MSDLHVANLDPPRIGLLIDDALELHVDFLALAKHLIQFESA
jgi:hypothetical protein